MKKWLGYFKYDPITPLLETRNSAIVLIAERDLLDQALQVEKLWQLPEVQRILRRQKQNGSWTYPGGKEYVRTVENYDQIETYRNLGFLVEEYGLNQKHPSIQKAAEYLFSFQTKEGDFRGIYGNQYSPNYTAGITELLIKAGYENDTRIKGVFKWLLSIRQTDGGWAIPLRTQNLNLDVISGHSKTIEPDTSKPFSHMVTGVVLRAFAAHSVYRKSHEAGQAGQLLVSNLFKKDNYTDRAAPRFWLGFSFPFWFTDLISALDSLSLLGFTKSDAQIDKALQWLINNQQKTGMWKLHILKGQNKDILQLWLTLAICRIFKRFESNEERRQI
jgi:hypothetical protein